MKIRMNSTGPLVYVGLRGIKNNVIWLEEGCPSLYRMLVGTRPSFVHCIKASRGQGNNNNTRIHRTKMQLQLMLVLSKDGHSPNMYVFFKKDG